MKYYENDFDGYIVSVSVDRGSAEITVNVQGGGGVQRTTGTFTPSETHTTNYSYPITTVEALGFTPKIFILSVKDAQDVYGVQYALLQNSYTESGDTPTYQRSMSRYSNTTGGKSGATVQTGWTTNAQSYLYLNNGTIFFNVSPTCILVGNVDYVWAAYSA